LTRFEELQASINKNNRKKFSQVRKDDSIQVEAEAITESEMLSILSISKERLN